MAWGSRYTYTYTLGFKYRENLYDRETLPFLASSPGLLLINFQYNARELGLGPGIRQFF